MEKITVEIEFIDTRHEVGQYPVELIKHALEMYFGQCDEIKVTELTSLRLDGDKEAIKNEFYQEFHFLHFMVKNDLWNWFKEKLSLSSDEKGMVNECDKICIHCGYAQHRHSRPALYCPIVDNRGETQGIDRTSTFK